MSSTGHYLKPGIKCTTPGVVISVAVECETQGDIDSGRYVPKVWKRAAATISKKRRGKWSLPEIVTFDDRGELIHWLHSVAETRRRNYVICPCASDVLVHSHFWEYAECKGIVFTSKKQEKMYGGRDATLRDMLSIRRVVLRGKIDIFDYSHLQRRMLWLSTGNYFDLDTNGLASLCINTIPIQLSRQIDSMGGFARVGYEALIHGHAFRMLADWWGENALAPFGLTVGALSVGVLRTHVKPKALCTHADSETHRLERLACYGGRASTWFVGNVGLGYGSSFNGSEKVGSHPIVSISGPISHIDIRSMYPTLLRDRMFPSHYVKRVTECTTEQLREYCQIYGTIATVTIDSDSGEYPLRRNNRLEFPRGVFTTVLAGPDIESIRGKDQILKVHNVALYRLGTPYKEAAAYLLSARKKAQEQDNKPWEHFTKTLANSMGGKLAQRRSKTIERRDHIAEKLWGEWITIDYDTGGYKRFRAISGMVFEICPDDSGEGPYTASFAYLTAYGRQLMRTLRESIGPYAVVSQDTDGLWTLLTEQQLRSSSCIPFGNLPGQLRIMEVSSNARFLGPKHYYTDSGWTLAGYHNFSVKEGTTRVRHETTINPLTRGSTSIPRQILTKYSEVSIEYANAGCEVFPDNWVRPLFIDGAPNLDSVV